MIRLCALAAALITTCCAPLPENRSSGYDPMTLESICARSLQQLDDLISARVAAGPGQTAGAAIFEASALRAAAAELYLDGENELALELIEEAFELLETRK